MRTVDVETIRTERDTNIKAVCPSFAHHINTSSVEVLTEEQHTSPTWHVKQVLYTGDYQVIYVVKEIV